MSRHRSARFTLLDQQVIDANGGLVGRVDDISIDVPAVGPPVITELRIGAQALGERLGGGAGRLMAAVAMRCRSGGTPSQAGRIPAELITDANDLVCLSLPLRDLPQLAGLERWLSQNLVQHFPGAGPCG